jgi:hypothetical protein
VTPQLLSARAAVRRTGIPWRELRAALERDGGRVVRIGKRDRIDEADLNSLIEHGRQPTAVEVAAQVDAALDETLREMGLPGKRARRRKAVTTGP